MSTANPTNPPREVVRRLRAADFLRLMVATTLLVLFFNLICVWYLRTFPANASYWLIREKWRMLKDLDKPVDWLVLGDSSANQGIVPSTLNESLNTSSINLSTIADVTLVGDLWMLETYLRKFGAPRNVLIVRVYDSWHRDIEPQVLAQLPAELGNSLVWDDQVSCSRECKLRYLFARFVPLYSENATLSRLIKNPSKLFEAPLHLEPDGYLRASKPEPDRVVADANLHVSRYHSGQQLRLSRLNRESLQKIRALADQNGFDVFLASSPLYDQLYQAEGIQKYSREVWDQIVSITSGSSRLHYIQDPMTFPKEQMTSVDHVIDSAARVFTRHLAASILSLQTAKEKHPDTTRR